VGLPGGAAGPERDGGEPHSRQQCGLEEALDEAFLGDSFDQDVDLLHGGHVYRPCSVRGRPPRRFLSHRSPRE
jgi:hypothetical protein